MILLVVVAVIWFYFKADSENDLDECLTMTSNSQRVNLLNKAGWIVAPDPVEEEKVLIPSEFNEAYGDYNKIQLEQGFDLAKYSGEEAKIYTYTILNYPDFPENITANLIFVNERLVGADISQTTENGFVIPLISGNVADMGCVPTETTIPVETTAVETTTAIVTTAPLETSATQTATGTTVATTSATSQPTR